MDGRASKGSPDEALPPSPNRRWLQGVWRLLLLLQAASLFSVGTEAAFRPLTAPFLTLYGIGFLVIAATLAATWALGVGKFAVAFSRDLSLGLALGLLWTIEIGFNNILAWPVAQRDVVDNLFWGVIALAILAGAASATYQSGRLMRGVFSGALMGLASGSVACCTALLLIVFGMPLLLSDPVNQAEWAAVAKQTDVRSMSDYFARETFAGALGHLVVLGVAMGIMLGVIGGLIGYVVKAVNRG